jgi:hypothetical protein
MVSRLLNSRHIKAGLTGLATAVREVATRTDRAVQLARLRIALWELNRELLIVYREFGQRVSELALNPGSVSGVVDHTASGPIPSDDPELIRVSGEIERLQARLELLTQQLAALNLEAPEDWDAPLRRRLHTAGLMEIVAVIPKRSPLARRPLSSVRSTAECVITAIIRNGSPFVPSGATTLEPGDELVLFGSAMACEQAKQYFERTEEETFPQTL